MLVRKIISPFLILLYLSAVVGIAFYNCHCEHSQRLVLLTYDHCTCAHDAYVHEHDRGGASNSDCQSSAGVCPSDEGDCCQVVYKSIKIDQEGTTQQVKTPANNIPLFTVAAILPSLCDVPEICSAHCPFDYSKSPPDRYKTSLIYHNRQLRL